MSVSLLTRLLMLRGSPICPRARRRRAVGFSLVEMLIATAVLAGAAMGIYAVFLRMNEAAADLRFYTSAKQLLERATTQALTVAWTTELETTNKRPAILTPTGTLSGQDSEGFVVCDIDNSSTDPAYNNGIYSLFIDPNNNAEGNMACTLHRKVKEVRMLPAGSVPPQIDDGKMLLQIAFKVTYTVHGRQKPSMYFYTARARSKN